MVERASLGVHHFHLDADRWGDLNVCAKSSHCGHFQLAHLNWQPWKQALDGWLHPECTRLLPFLARGHQKLQRHPLQVQVGLLSIFSLWATWSKFPFVKVFYLLSSFFFSFWQGFLNLLSRLNPLANVSLPFAKVFLPFVKVLLPFGLVFYLLARLT